jgi:uncharacterized membrane protein
LYLEVISLSEKTPLEKMYSAFFESELPPDLILILIWLPAAIITIYLPVLNTTPLRYVLTLPVVLFIPGYCLIAALFPKEGEIGLAERIMLSIGCSIAVVPLICLGLNFTPWGIRLEPIVIALILFTLVMILIAHYRRDLLPPEERFRIRFSAIAGTIREEMVPSEERGIDHALSIVLALVIIIAIIATVYVILAPKEGERFSEFYILNENQIASDYPDQIVPGTNYPMFIGVGNQEHRNVTYTIETWNLRTDFDYVTNTSHIITMDPGERQALTLTQNETRIIPYTLSVEKTGYDRVEFLLFNETIPGSEVTGSDRINASYRDLHLWITDY